MKQLPLPFAEAPSYAAADFLESPSNALARTWLARPKAWTNGRLVLWGEPGCGKTHLLHLWARDHAAQIVNGPQLRDFSSPAAPLAIDDADLVPDEAVLLHLLNTAAEAAIPVLLTTREPPGRGAQKLADLKSRLRAAEAVEIRPPEDELLAALLAHLAADRQLALNIQVRNYLLTHLPRTPAALREAVARLDRAALDRSGKITRQLAAELLRDLSGDAELLSNGHSP